MLDSKPELFRLLHDDLHGELGGYISKLMSHRMLDCQEYEDVEQTVWMKVWTSIESVTQRPDHGKHDGLRAWIFTVAHNTVMDLMRKARYRSHFCLEPDGLIRVSTGVTIGHQFEASSSSDPHECLIASETAALLRQALDAMTNRQATCIRANLAGYDSLEIAEVTGTTSVSVRHAWLRGRRRIQNLMDQQEIRCP